MCLKDIHPDDLDKFKSYVKHGKKGMQLDSITYRRRNQDGKYAWIRSNKKNIFNENGKLVRVLGMAQDISAKWKHLRR